MLLRGANIMHSEWVAQWGMDMEWERRAIPALSGSWNGNICVRGFAADPVDADNPQYLGMLDEYVSLTARSRIYLMLSFRSYGINGEQPEMPDDRAARALAKLAARYRGRSHVLYSLQVEPHDVDWATLRPLFEDMVDAVRTAAAPHVPLIMVPGTDWSRDLTGAIDDPVRRENIVYNSHPYNPSSDFQRLFGRAHDAGLPVFVGEFGPFDPMTMADVVDLLSFTRQRGIGWAAWSFDHDDPNPLHKLVHQSLLPTTPYGTTVRSEMLATPPLP
ncbi:glycoside hydrolase family 5 protein [Benzoatithermus flavus]|uniref:Cellulase family glycosylhydrolase n=1 Tax=Benzoatithermus flavus TaxID=3108223 RepID=A0ABU8XRS7_9PROT